MFKKVENHDRKEWEKSFWKQHSGLKTTEEAEAGDKQKKTGSPKKKEHVKKQRQKRQDFWKSADEKRRKRQAPIDELEDAAMLEAR